MPRRPSTRATANVFNGRWRSFDSPDDPSPSIGRPGAAPAAARLGCDVAEIAILPDHRAALHARIAQRLDAMLNRGLVDEVRALRDDPMLHVDLPSMRAVGYRQVWRHLDGDYGHAEMVSRVAAATRQVAKRQLTWLRRWGADAVSDAESAAEQALQKIERERIVALH